MASNQEENNVAEETNSTAACILSISYEKAFMGCSYFDLDKNEISVAYPIADPGPTFSILHNIFRNLKPEYCLASCTGSNQVLYEILKILKYPETVNPVNFRISRNPRKNNPIDFGDFFVYPFHAKNLYINRNRIYQLHLPGMKAGIQENERKYLLESIFPLNHDIIVHSLGNLLHFLDQNWRHLFLQHLNQPMITNMRVFYLNSQLLIDNSTLNALQIFSAVQHPSAYKKGQSDPKKHNRVSLYSLLNRCSSSIGSKYLHTLLHQPLRNLPSLLSSYETIQWFIENNDPDKMHKIRSYMKNINDISLNYKQLCFNPNNVNNWVRFKKTIYYAFQLINYCKTLTNMELLDHDSDEDQENQSNEEKLEDKTNDPSDSMVVQIAKMDSRQFRECLFTLENIADIDTMLEQRRFIVRVGMDSLLDEKRLRMFEIQDEIKDIITTECDDLPLFITDVEGYYIPEIGYVARLQFGNLSDPPLAVVENDDLKFLVKSDDNYFFKSNLCDELNEKYGHIWVDICEHEQRISQRFLEYVNEILPFLQDGIKKLAKFDVLMAFATISIEKQLCRPIISSKKIFKIENGWHILWNVNEFSAEKFKPNNTDVSVKNENLITILTAPNGSGKTVYIKEIAIIAFMAHIGCYVPASYAQIPLLDSIFSCVYQSEAIYMESSSFLTDLKQMNCILTNSTGNSLILIDEFGNGTNPIEGEALLCSALTELSGRGENCPITFVSTHYNDCHDYIKGKRNISFMTILNQELQDKSLISTYRFISGRNTWENYARRIERVKDFFDAIFQENNDDQRGAVKNTGILKEDRTGRFNHLRINKSDGQLPSEVKIQHGFDFFKSFLENDENFDLEILGKVLREEGEIFEEII